MASKKKPPQAAAPAPPELPDDDLPAEPAATPPPELPPVEETPKPIQHSKAVLRWARELGISQEFCDKTNPDDLLEEIDYRRKQQEQEFERQRLAKQEERERYLLEQTRQAPAPPPREAPRVKLGLNPNDYAPEYVEALETSLGRALAERDAEHAREIAALKEEAKQIKERDKQREADSLNDQLDEAFEQIGRPDLYGEGPIRDMDPRSTECRRRVRIAREAMQERGSPKRNALRIHEEMYGKQEKTEPIPAPIPDPIAERKAQWTNGGLAKPTHRETAEPPGYEKAVKELRTNLNNRGIPQVPLSFEEEESLPE